VSDFSVHTAVEQGAIVEERSANPGSDGDVRDMFRVFGGTVFGFTDDGGVDVGIKKNGDGQLQAFADSVDYIIATLSTLGCGEDGAIPGRTRLDIRRAKGADAHGADRAISGGGFLEKRNRLCDGLLRITGGKARF